MEPKDPGRHECHGSWISNTLPGLGRLGQLPPLEGGSYGSGWEASLWQQGELSPALSGPCPVTSVTSEHCTSDLSFNY